MANHRMTILLVLLACCNEAPSSRGDGGGDEADAHDSGSEDGEGGRLDADDGGGDVGPDADLGPAEGPLTHVADQNAFIVERLCDLDADGALDNAFADLGPVEGPIATGAFNSFLGDPRETVLRWLFHFPWIDDLHRLDDDATTLIFALGEDSDVPRDAGDDFDGDESFYARATGLDACGEPRSFFPSTVVEDGRVETTTRGDLHLDIGDDLFLVARSGSISGTISPGAGSGEWLLCGAMLISEIGEAIVTDVDVGDVSMLELMVAGGAALGLPALPGVTPDLDLDGDGLERLVVDAQSRIVRCIDGDLTTIEGRDCWRDPRMADAFSFNMRFRTVRAHFSGRLPGWEGRVEGSCESPPDPSAWDPS